MSAQSTGLVTPTNTFMCSRKQTACPSSGEARSPGQGIAKRHANCWAPSLSQGLPTGLGYPQDAFGGYGWTRTTDPSIMSAVL